MEPKKPRGNPAWAKDPLTGRGKSGNPGGTRSTPLEVRKWLEDRCQQAAERLVELTASPNEKIALAATLAVLEWGIGKPVQVVATYGEGADPLDPGSKEFDRVMREKYGTETRLFDTETDKPGQ